jgi:hypothetical protein
MSNPVIDSGGNTGWYNETDQRNICFYIKNKRKHRNSSFKSAVKISDDDLLMFILKYGNIKSTCYPK